MSLTGISETGLWRVPEELSVKGPALAVGGRGNSRAIWDHTVFTCHPAEVTFQPLPQPKLVLDLATPEGCKAELT